MVVLSSTTRQLWFGLTFVAANEVLRSQTHNASDIGAEQVAKAFGQHLRSGKAEQHKIRDRRLFIMRGILSVFELAVFMLLPWTE